MANEKNISGNLRLRLNDKVIFDATQCSLDMTREVTSRAGTKDSAAGSSSKGTKTWTASYNGLGVYAGDGADGHQFKDLVDLWNDDTETLVEVEFVPSEADYQWYYEGDGIVTALNGVFAFSEDSTISITISGSGPLTPVDKAVTAPGA